MGREDDQFIEGTLEMLILRALRRGPQHGYAVAEFITEASRAVLRVEEGSLYPALHRLEAKGLLLSKWGVSANNRKAKFYRLTDEGRKRLHAGTQTWHAYAEAVGKLLGATRPPAPEEL